MEEARQYSTVEIASIMLAQFLHDKSSWWSGELQTLTGYDRRHFEELADRVQHSDASLDKNNKLMLHTVANTFMGYPFGPTPILDEKLGENWENTIKGEFLPNWTGYWDGLR